MQPGKQRNPVTTLVLLLVSCALYYPYWLYVTACDMQAFEPDSTDLPPVVETVLLIVTGGLYVFWWDYKTAKKIVRMQQKVGIEPTTDNSTLYLIFDLIGIGIATPLMQQTHLNQIWERAGGRVAY